MTSHAEALLKHPNLGSARSWGAAHSRHVKNGISFKESCKICNPLFVAPPKAAGVQPEIPNSKANPDSPAFAEAKANEVIDFSRLYRLVERRRPLSEIAELFNKTPEQIRQLAQERFQMPWETLAARAPLELQHDLLDTVYRKARMGDVRFVLILEKWGLLDTKMDGGGSDRPIQGFSGEVLRSLSTEELQSRAQRYERQVAMLKKTLKRPPRFWVTGQLSPTLELRDAVPEEQLPDERPWVPTSKDADPPKQEAVNLPPEEQAADEIPSKPTVNENLARGPAVYNPPHEEPLRI